MVARPVVDVDYVEAVLSCAELVPVGKATSYGAIAEVVAQRLGRGGPRQVARVMATHGGGVPWWRVVRADGTLPIELQARAAENYSAEGTLRRANGGVRFPAAWWQPELEALQTAEQRAPER
ncbi:MGMT family protein [Nocardioides sp. Bht2]|uniref:MGMT family protein n=1 Tax=Nocardioides sp. Bht2 TaxID=3392297 RepID=UPI0039B616CF